MLRSKKESKDMNANLVKTQIGKYELYQDLISLTVWDEYGNEYSIKSLLEKIIELEANIKTLENKLTNADDAIKLSLTTYTTTNDNNVSLIAKAVDLISLQNSSLSKDIEDLKDKTKFL